MSVSVCVGNITDLLTITRGVLSVAKQSNVPLALFAMRYDSRYIELGFPCAPDFHFFQGRVTRQNGHFNGVAMAIDQLFCLFTFAFLFNPGRNGALGIASRNAPENHLPHGCVARRGNSCNFVLRIGRCSGQNQRGCRQDLQQFGLNCNIHKQIPSGRSQSDTSMTSD